MGKEHLAAREQSSQASRSWSFPVTWGLFGHKLWETDMTKVWEARGCAAKSSLVLAATMELEGWLLLQ